MYRQVIRSGTRHQTADSFFTKPTCRCTRVPAVAPVFSQTVKFLECTLTNGTTEAQKMHRDSAHSLCGFLHQPLFPSRWKIGLRSQHDQNNREVGSLPIHERSIRTALEAIQHETTRRT